jgi:hypothetical protein
MGAKSHARSITWAISLAEKTVLPRAVLERLSGTVLARTPNIWELYGTAIIVPHQGSMMQGKSSEYQTPGKEFFPSFGL